MQNEGRKEKKEKDGKGRVTRVNVCVVEEKIMLSSPSQLFTDTWQVEIPFIFLRPQLSKITTGTH